MKPIPIENEELEISFEICPLDNMQVTQSRIDKVRDKIKKVQSEGQKSMLLKLCEILIDIVDNWDRNESLLIINRAILCLQNVASLLAKKKEKFLKHGNKS